MKFYLLRAKILIVLIRIFGTILGVEIPPIPSVAAIAEKNGKLLVVDLTYRNGLSLPGGIVKRGEDAEEALRREVKEETGLDITSMNYFGSFISGKETYGVNMAYIVKVEGELKNSSEGVAIWQDPKIAVNKFAYKDNMAAVRKYFHIK